MVDGQKEFPLALNKLQYPLIAGPATKLKTPNENMVKNSHIFYFLYFKNP